MLRLRRAGHGQDITCGKSVLTWLGFVATRDAKACFLRGTAFASGDAFLRAVAKGVLFLFRTPGRSGTRRPLLRLKERATRGTKTNPVLQGCRRRRDRFVIEMRRRSPQKGLWASDEGDADASSGRRRERDRCPHEKRRSSGTFPAIPKRRRGTGLWCSDRTSTSSSSTSSMQRVGEGVFAPPAPSNLWRARSLLILVMLGGPWTRVGPLFYR